MSCDKILTLLSAYIDGEVEAGEARSIEEHTANCEACARELRILRETAEMISAVSEVEPPAFLLEQIEAATVNKPTPKDRMREVFAPIFRIPTQFRWAAVTAAAAGILAFSIMSQPEHTSQVVVDPPSSDIVAVQPIEIDEVGEVEEIEDADSITVVERTPRIARTRPVAVQTQTAEKTDSSETKVAMTTEEQLEEDIAEVDEFEIKPHIGNEIYGPMMPVQDEPVMIAEEPVQEEIEQVIQIVVASTPITDRLEMENEVLHELREQIAVRNKQRQYGRVESIEKGKYLVELATVRF